MDEVSLGFANPDYENIRVLNHLGGTGDLFLAHKRGMNIEVVIKRIQPRFQHVMRQETESEILKSLKHEYLPRIYDVIYGLDGCIYTVMDLISGENLQQHIEHQGPATQKEIYRWACQLCEAVQYLHKASAEKPAIIHCDIKPGNVMITRDGNICLIDFNTSLIFQDDMASVGVTDGYAAPEQYSASAQKAGPAGGSSPTVLMPGNTAPAKRLNFIKQNKTVLMKKNDDENWTRSPQNRYGTISKATDIYAIGATLYFAATGRKPEKSLAEVTPIEEFKPRLSSSMLEIIHRAMQKQPTLRFQQASEMLRALKDVDKRDAAYKSYRVQKRILVAVLALCMTASICSCVYGVELMKSERENTYLLALAEASQAQQEQRYDDGQILLEQAIQQQPERADAYIQLAALLYRRGDYQEALDRLESAISSGTLKETNLDAVSQEQMYYIMGNCFYELGDYTQAVAKLSRAAAQQGADTNSYRSLAIALANDGKLEQAQEILEQLREKGASSGDCDLIAAEICVVKKDYGSSLALYEKVFVEVTDTQLLSHAFLSAANAASESGDSTYAIDLLERGCEALPENQTVLLTEMLAELYSTQALTDKENSNTFYQKAEQLLQELVDSGYATITTRMNLATVLRSLDKFEQAQDVLNQMIVEYPQDYRLDMQMTYLLLDWQGTLPSASRDYKYAVEFYTSAQEKYGQAQANGTEDSQMVILSSLIEQLRAGGWIK